MRETSRPDQECERIEGAGVWVLVMVEVGPGGRALSRGEKHVRRKREGKKESLPHTHLVYKGETKKHKYEENREQE